MDFQINALYCVAKKKLSLELALSIDGGHFALASGGHKNVCASICGWPGHDNCLDSPHLVPS